jgi:hypothetical protein
VLYLSPGLLDAQYFLAAWLCLFCVPLLGLSEINEGIARAHGRMNTALALTYLLRPILLIAGAFVAAQAGLTLTAALSMSIAILACFLTILAQSAVMLIRLRRIDRGDGILANPMTWLSASVPRVLLPRRAISECSWAAENLCFGIAHGCRAQYGAEYHSDSDAWSARCSNRNVSVARRVDRLSVCDRPEAYRHLAQAKLANRDAAQIREGQ